MYENIKTQIDAHYANEHKKFLDALPGLTVRDVRDFWYYREKLTPAASRALADLDNDAAIPEAVQKKMLAKFERENDKRKIVMLDKLLHAQEAGLPESVNISVEYRRDRYWGNHKPFATVEALTDKRRHETKASAGGCGYDKTSAAIASACNANPAIMAILYAHAEKGLPFSYSVHTFAGVPSFDVGCGVSCFYNVFDECGYIFRQVADGKSFSVFTLTRKGAL